MRKSVVSWRQGAFWCIANSEMFIVLIVSGLVGSLFYYSMLDGLMKGKLERSWAIWTRCVAASALLISVSATVVVYYFDANANIWLTFSLWPLMILVLHGGYWVVASDAQKRTNDEVQDAE